MTNKEKYMELWNKAHETERQLNFAFAEWQRPIHEPGSQARYYRLKKKLEKLEAEMKQLQHNYYFHGNEPYVEEVAN